MTSRTVQSPISVMGSMIGYMIRLSLPALIYAFHSHYQDHIRYMDFMFQNSVLVPTLYHYDYVIFGTMYGLAALSAGGLVYSLQAIIKKPEPVFFKYLMVPVFIVSAVFYVYVVFKTAMSGIVFTLAWIVGIAPMAFIAAIALLILAYPLVMIPQVMQEH